MVQGPETEKKAANEDSPSLNGTYIANPKESLLRAKRRRAVLFAVILAILALGAAAAAFLPRQEAGAPVVDPEAMLYGHYRTGDKSGLTNSDITVCIDPGHGFSDPGADSEFIGSYDERDINLAIALELEGFLRDYGFNTVMTRINDVAPSDYIGAESYTLDPVARAEFANALPGDVLFISLHCDSFTADPTVSGIRLYYYTMNSGYTPYFAKQLAESIAAGMGTAAPKIMPKSSANAFYVNKYVNAPSILIECGFITNQSDAERLLSGEYRSGLALAIADGIVAFVG